MNALADARLYTFVDAGYLAGRDPVELARQLCDGGSDVIQFRAKDWPLDRIRQVAESIHKITHRAGVPLVVNDHVGVATAIGAEFCHLGQEDFFEAGYSNTKQLQQGSSLKFGLSTHSPAQAARSLQANPDYIAIGPVFPTPTKPTAAAVTLEYVRWASANVLIPWFAIGGINLTNLDAVLAAGATRICVVSAILNSQNVAKTCSQFRERLTFRPPKAG